MTRELEVNVFANGDEWLFGDLKDHFARTKVPGIRVVTSEQPERGADAWVAIRTHEASSTPNPKRTVACIHDLYQKNRIYAPEGLRGVVHRVGGLVLSHPGQRRLLQEAAVDLKRPAVMERPLGALSSFETRTAMPQRFTVGWVGRNDPRKRMEWLIPVCEALSLGGLDFELMLVGKDLDSMVNRLRASGIACGHFPRSGFPASSYPQRYQAMDCLLITSLTEAGPLTLFEALASGIPVVSSPVGWAPHLAKRKPDLVLLSDRPEGLANHLIRLAAKREAMFSRRHELSSLVKDYRLDTWFPGVLKLAASLCQPVGSK